MFITFQWTQIDSLRVLTSKNSLLSLLLSKTTLSFIKWQYRSVNNHAVSFSATNARVCGTASLFTKSVGIPKPNAHEEMDCESEIHSHVNLFNIVVSESGQSEQHTNLYLPNFSNPIAFHILTLCIHIVAIMNFLIARNPNKHNCERWTSFSFVNYLLIKNPMLVFSTSTNWPLGPCG